MLKPDLSLIQCITIITTPFDLIIITHNSKPNITITLLVVLMLVIFRNIDHHNHINSAIKNSAGVTINIVILILSH